MTKLCLVFALLPLGCITNDHLDDGPPPNVCGAAGNVFSIDDNAPIDYTPGVDAGYYVTYLGNGAWHVEWTCDTKLSADGCEFTGTITADTPASGPNATCYDCEAVDQVAAAATANGPQGEAQMAIAFDTQTTTAIDGVDFTSTPGSTVTFDIQIDGVYYPDLVFLSSGNAAASPPCIPFLLTPTAP